MEMNEERGMPATSKLRRRAEDRLKTESPEGLKRATDKSQRLCYELQIHKIELEMQNEELKAARYEVEKSLEKYSDLFEFAPMGYFILDRNGTISSANLNGAGFLGIERMGLLGRRFVRFVTEEYRTAFNDFLAKILVNASRESCEVMLLKEGIHPFFVHIEGLVSSPGEECRIALIDITYRKNMEEQALHLASFPQLNPDPVLEVDASGKVSYSNPATQITLKRLGVAERETNLFVPSDMDDILKNWSRKDDVTLYREICIKEGTFWETIFLTHQFDVARIYVKDISKRKQAEKDLELLNKSLETRVVEMAGDLSRKDQAMIQLNSLAVMGDMISNIAHQWRQPLNTIALIIQNIQCEYEAGTLTTEEMNSGIDDTMEIIVEMSQTIDDFRSFFLPDKEKHEFSISEAVNRAISLVSASLYSQNIQVKIITDDDVTAFGYQNEYSQVLLNMFSNSCNICSERNVADCRIIIRITRENERSVLYFRDNCGGIPDEVLPRIFDQFFTTRGSDKGSGIGLYMSRMIIEQNMGGSLTAGNDGGGAEFRIEV